MLFDEMHPKIVKSVPSGVKLNVYEGGLHYSVPKSGIKFSQKKFVKTFNFSYPSHQIYLRAQNPKKTSIYAI